MRRHDGRAYAGRYRRAREIQRFLERLGAIIDAWKIMAVKIDHEVAGTVRLYAQTILSTSCNSRRTCSNCRYTRRNSAALS